MGRLQAQAIAEDTSIPLDTQIRWHLTSNHYPPVPDIMVPVCIVAIEKANNGEWDDEVELPEHVSWRGLTTVPVHAIVEQHHLDAWIIEEESY